MTLQFIHSKHAHDYRGLFTGYTRFVFYYEFGKILVYNITKQIIYFDNGITTDCFYLNLKKL